MSKTETIILSLVLSLLSCFPFIVFLGGTSFAANYYENIEKYWFVFLPLAFLCGIVGIKLGLKVLKENKVLIIFIIISGIGAITSLLLLFFGLYLGTFE